MYESEENQSQSLSFDRDLASGGNSQCLGTSGVPNGYPEPRLLG